MAARTATNKKTPVNPSAEVDHAENDSGRVRTQLAVVLNINISQARCATHLKQNLGDDETEVEIKGLRSSLATAKAGGATEAALDVIKTQIAEKSKKLVRISSGTPIAVAVTCDSAVKELLRHGLDEAIKTSSKAVNTAHLHSGSPENLVYFPLYDKCDVWSKYSQEREDEIKRNKTALAKVAKEARDQAKAPAAPAPAPVAPAAAATATDAAPAKKKKAKAKAEPEVKVVVPVAAAAAADDEGVKTTFNTYVDNALKVVRQENVKYNEYRVSGRVREYLSDLVIQMIARQAKLAKVMVQMVMGVRTMNHDHVKAAINILMTDSNRTNEQIKTVTDQVNEKLYSDHNESEKKKKLELLDDEKRADLKRKQLESDIQRKSKQVANAELQAAKAAKRSSELKTEAELLQKGAAAS
jgi:hypothetical protein